MTSVNDFASRDSARALDSTDSPDDSPSNAQSLTSPTSPRQYAIDERRPSVTSIQTTNTIGMRHRHPKRSNTITTYHEPVHPNWQPGAEPGIDTSTEDEKTPARLSNIKADCEINIMDFSDTDLRHCQATNATLSEYLDDPRPEGMVCRWISVNGLSWDVVKCLGNKFNLHRLAIEDLLHDHTRTKVDWYADHAFVVLTLQKLVRLHQHKGREGNCDCSARMDDDDEDDDSEDSDSKKPVVNQSDARSYPAEQRSWWQQSAKKPRGSLLPRYMDADMDGKVDEFVQAHSGVSESTPIKPIRTLHRYESAQIPEHTAFMERHSALSAEDLAVSVEQVSLFLLADNTVISFFEHSAPDIETPIWERLKSTETMLRRSCDASLMLQAIIDTIVDLAGPVKDAYNKSRKELQVDAMTNPDIKTSRALHIFGEEIDMLQNLFKPIVHLVNALRDHNSEPLMPAPPIQPPGELHSMNQQHRKSHLHETTRDRGGDLKFNRSMSDLRRTTLKAPLNATSVSITPLAHTYFGDVLDHCITMIQTLEQMDASAANISTLIFNTVGAKTNNFMMILAVVTVFFAPLTFISGYFGMNFSSGAGLAHPFAFFWIIATPSLVAFMLLVFGYMLADNIKDFFTRRGIKSRRSSRRLVAARRLAGKST